MFFDNIIRRLIKNINVSESWESSLETVIMPKVSQPSHKKTFSVFLSLNSGSSYYKVTGSVMVSPYTELNHKHNLIDFFKAGLAPFDSS